MIPAFKTTKKTRRSFKSEFESVSKAEFYMQNGSKLKERGHLECSNR